MADGMMLVAWFFVVLLVGIVAFFILLVAGVLRLFGLFLRGLFGGWWHRARTPRTPGPLPRTCANRHCRHVNPPEARYCARCGLPLG